LGKPPLEVATNDDAGDGGGDAADDGADGARSLE